MRKARSRAKETCCGPSARVSPMPRKLDVPDRLSVFDIQLELLALDGDLSGHDLFMASHFVVRDVLADPHARCVITAG